MRTQSSFQPEGFWLVTIAAMIWGTIGVATRAIYAADVTTTLFINLARMAVAAPILFGVGWHTLGRGMFRVRRRDVPYLLVNGGLLAISQAAYFAAVRESGVTIATLLTCCASPVLVAGISVLLRLEVLTHRILLALICSLIGGVLLVGFQTPEGTDFNLLSGATLSLVSAATYAGVILSGRVLAGRYHPTQVTAFTFAIGSLVLIVLNLVSGIVPVHSAQGWLLILYLGIVPTALAYWLFQKGLRSVSATAASIVTLLEPTVAALLAWAMFGETLASTGLIGAGLLLMSIVLLSGAGEGNRLAANAENSL